MPNGLFSAFGSLGNLVGRSAAGGGGGMPWSIILPIALSFLQSSGVFGETETERQDRLYNELMNMIRPQYEYWGKQATGLNPIVMKALLEQFKRSANWGWPEGKGMDLGFLENANIPGVTGGRVRRRV